MLGEGVTIGADNVITNGARIFPGVELPDGAIQFLAVAAPLDARRSPPSTPRASSADILDLPDHLRDALWRVESAALQPFDAPGGLVVAGMGGSGIGGALARAALGAAPARPIALARDYDAAGLDAARRRSCCARATRATPRRRWPPTRRPARSAAPRVVVTTRRQARRRARARDGVPVIPLPGGFQPRAAVGYMLVAALEVAALSGAAPSLRAEIDVAAAHAEALAAEWGPDGAEDSRPSRSRARSTARCR